MKSNQITISNDMEPICNFQGLSHIFPIRNVKKHFNLFVDRPFCGMVGEETNKFVAFSPPPPHTRKQIYFIPTSKTPMQTKLDICKP
jgi:hypothetical protein